MNVIVDITNNQPKFALIQSEDNISFVDSLIKCSKFTSDSDIAISYWLNYCRVSYPLRKFVVCSVNKHLLGRPILNIYDLDIKVSSKYQNLF